MASDVGGGVLRWSYVDGGGWAQRHNLTNLFPVDGNTKEALDHHGAAISRANKLNEILQAHRTACCGTDDKLTKFDHVDR